MDRTLTVSIGDRTRHLVVRDDGTVVVEGVTFRVAAAPAAGEIVVSNGTSVARMFLTSDEETTWIFFDGQVYELTVEREGGNRSASGARRRAQHAGSLTAPMPATVVSIHARPGDHVQRGAILIVLEAMKMELPVRAPGDGTIASVLCAPGDLVQPGVPLIEMQ
jgi:3-methylcrotonyl-CoA carboxylase alpha subunit